MAKKHRLPRIISILWVDVWAQIFIALVIILWFFRSIYSNSPAVSSLGNPIALIATLTGILLLIWRVRYIRAFFAHGEVINGTVTQVWPVRGGHDVHYDYNYQRHPYHASARVPDWHTEMRRGDTIKLMVDPQNPKKVFIRDVYFW